MKRRKFVKLICGTIASWPVLLFAAPALCLLTVRLLADERGAIPVVVADFDYHDTSGEVADQRMEHAARVKVFARMGVWAAGTPITRNGAAENYVFRVSAVDALVDKALLSYAIKKYGAQPRRSLARRLC